MIVLLIYLADLVNGLMAFAMIGACVLGFTAFGCLLIHEEINATVKKLVTWAFVFGLVAAFIPSKNTVYMIAAVKFGESIADKPSVQVVGDKVMTLLQSKLDEAIEESTKKTKKKSSGE